MHKDTLCKQDHSTKAKTRVKSMALQEQFTVDPHAKKTQETIYKLVQARVLKVSDHFSREFKKIFVAQEIHKSSNSN